VRNSVPYETGPTGPNGPTGPTGNTGITGPTGEATLTRYRFTAAGGETSVSGADDNAATLSYTAGKEQVFYNGVLLVRGLDYTASNGTSISSLVALTANDVIEVLAIGTFNIADGILATTIDAKGDLLVGTANDTVARFAVGTDGQYLKANSGVTGGLQWSDVAGALAQPEEPSSPSDGQIWIDTDGSVVGQAVTRWSKVMSAGVTAVSGLDDSSVTLTYTSGYEQVYRNGALLSRGNDYTATNGTSITLIDATLANDVIEVIGSAVLGIADVYTQTQSNAAYIGKALVDAKGDVLTATAADTPARLAVGANDTVLTADSSTATGLKWATPAAGGITLITETVASANTSISFSSIPQTYKQLLLVWSGIYHTVADSDFVLRFNNASTSSYGEGYIVGIASVTSGQGTGTYVAGAASWPTFGSVTSSANLNGGSKGFLLIDNYTSTTKLKPYDFVGSYRESQVGRNYAYSGSGTFDSTSAITSLDIVRTAGTGAMTNVTNTTIRLYGLS
jgi:hypothetical protein